MSAKDKIIEIINKDSFVSLEEFMSISLHDKDYGYYRTKDPIGVHGDFITSPEISQLYGEMLGLWLSHQIISKGIKKLNLIELGPGKGTLMSDIMRTLDKSVKIKVLINLHFLENNISFNKKLTKLFPSANFHSDIKTMPDGYSIYIANEFFDALPITQITKENNLLKYAVVKSDKPNCFYKEFINIKDNDSKFYLPSNLNLKNGDIYEFSKEADSILNTIAKKIKDSNGLFLFTDYGYKNLKFKNTLSAIQNNRVTDFFDNIGTQDLTSHVNFDNIKIKLENQGIKNIRFMTQSQFLKEMGIELRASKLIESNPMNEESIMIGLNRLIALDQMGSLFKVIFTEYN